MNRPAAKVSHVEVTRLIKAAQACGLTVTRVSFDGERVDVVTSNDKTPSTPRPSPATFQTIEEYVAWKESQGESGG